MKYRLYQPDPTVATSRHANIRNVEDLSNLSPDQYALVYEGDLFEGCNILKAIEDIRVHFWRDLPADFHGSKLAAGDLLLVETEKTGSQLYAYCQDDWVDGTFEKVPEDVTFDVAKTTDRRGSFCGVFLPVGGRAEARWVSVNRTACAGELSVGKAFQTLAIPFHDADLICEGAALHPRSVTDVNFNRALINSNISSDAIACTLYGNAFFCKFENSEYRSLPVKACENLKAQYLLPERLHVLDGAKRVTFKYYPNENGRLNHV